MARRWLLWVGPSLALASFFACDIGYEVDGPKFCRAAPEDPYCAGLNGSSGAAGVGGVGGAPAQGSAGAPMAGSGGGGGGTGGAGGGGACASDEGCSSDEGPGSLCVAEACTKATGACDAKALVVVAKVDEALAAAEPRTACFFRELAPALTVAGDGARVAAYAAAAVRVPNPVTVPAGVRLEGHAAEAGKATALEVTSPIGGSPLVTMAAGSALAGFALDGKGAAEGVAASSGAVRLEGPLRIAATTLAVELTDTAVATVRGTSAAPVVLTGNVRGIDVGQEAGLDLQGDGEAGGVLVETTGMAAGILIRAGGTAFENKVVGLSARDNIGTGPNGTGALEVRQGRKVTVTGGVFRRNSLGISLNGEGNSQFAAFANVLISGCTFENPSATTGTAICGSLFGGATQLVLGAGNVFPSGRQTPADCAALGTNQDDACNEGADLGLSDIAEPFDLSATCGT